MNEIEFLRSENQKLKIELEKIRKESTQYLQNVAHQLTAPLGAIKWSIEGLKTDKPVPIHVRQRLLSSVYSQATILVHLIKNFTLMSNLEADHELGQFREQPEPVDLLSLVINLANDFEPQAKDNLNKSIIINYESFENIFKKEKIRIIKNLVAQAISNLLENAVKYADADSKILIYAHEEKEFIGCKVVSEGIPISEDEQSKIFNRNYRGKSAKEKVPAGTGIGLYLVFKIINIHKGKIKLEINRKISQFMLLFPKTELVSGSKR